MKLNIVILAGGDGNRLWPFVNKDQPKPLLKLNGDKTLLEETIDRFSNLGDVFVVMSKEKIALAKKFIPEGKVEYIEEISAAGTSVAMRLAADSFLGKELILFSHADQLFDNRDDLHVAIKRGIPLAKGGQIVLFGTTPTSANTQFSYIQIGKNNVVEIVHMKPDLEKAQNLIKDKKNYWNTGISLMRTDVLIEAWEKHFDPKVRSFEPSILKKATNISAFPLDSAFIDIGVFENIESFLGLRIDSNYLSENVITKQVVNSLIISDKIPIKVIDVEDLIVVASKCGILISKRGSSSSQKELGFTKTN